MQSKKVSLIVPVYNTKKYLRRCLESAVSQTYRNMEIICVDDGSTDGSGEIVDEFAARDSRVIAIHQKNSGESNARNNGLKISSGDYIGFMDCDDWIEPDMYECLAGALEQADADMAIAGFYREFEECNVEPLVMDYIKRIIVYHSSYAAELAYKQQNRSMLKEFQELMHKYEKEYRRLNENRPDWIARFEKILQYKV